MPERHRIDWDSVRDRLANAEHSLARALDDDADRIARVLAERATAFADRAASRRGESADTVLGLVVRVGSERLALPITDLLEVVSLAQITAVPFAEPAVAGVINLRGEVRTIIDLGALIGVAGDGQAAYAVMVDSARGPCGLRVDALEEIRAIDNEDWSHVAENSFARARGGDQVTLLDVEAILDHGVFGNRTREG